MTEKFWETIPLDEMNAEQWESLCDGCGKCCTQVVEDEDTGEYHRLAVSCRLLDIDTCRCCDYTNRLALIEGCVQVTPELAHTAEWLPRTCAYRKLAHGEPLEWWHPLVSGDPETVHEAGVSVRDRVVSEEHVSDEEALAYELDD